MSSQCATGKRNPLDFYYFGLLTFGFFLGLYLTKTFPLKLDEPLILDYVYFDVIQPDHYSLFYLFVKPFIRLFGDSTVSMRLLPFGFFLLSIHVFYRYLSFVFNSKKTAFFGVMLLLLNSFFLNISIYAYEYSLFFLLAVTSIWLFDKFLVTGDYLTRVIITNIVGLAVFTMFYHVLISQLLMLVFVEKTRKIKLFLIANLVAFGVHFVFVTSKLLNFRFNSDRLPSLLDRNLGDFFGDLAGLDVNAVFYLREILILVSVALLALYVFSLIMNFIKHGPGANRYVFYLLLFSVSLVSFCVFKFLNMREIEYRYYFYLTPVFIISVLHLKNHLSRLSFRIIVGSLFLVTLTGFILFFRFVKYGENIDFMQKLEAVNRVNPGTVMYTNNLWNYRHMVLPVYYRQFRARPDNLQISETDNFAGLKEKHFWILQFMPESFENTRLPPDAKIRSMDKFACARCDTDQIRLIEYDNDGN